MYIYRFNIIQFLWLDFFYYFFGYTIYKVKYKTITRKGEPERTISFKKDQQLYKITKAFNVIWVKKRKSTAISKRDLAKRIGVDHNSITTWKKLYEKGGIDGIMLDGRIGFKNQVLWMQKNIRKYR